MTWRVQVTIAVSLSLFYGFFFVFQNIYDPVALDFGAFWTIANRADPYANIEKAFFVNPPTALIWLQPLRLVEPVPGYIAFTLLSAVLFALAAAKASDWRAAILSVFSAAVIQSLALGQIALLLGAAILWAVTLPSFRMGLVLGVVASIKPQLLVMAPLVFLIRRDFQAIGGMAAGAVASVTVSLIFGPSLWIDWCQQLAPFQQTVIDTGIWMWIVSPGFYAVYFGLPLLPLLAIGGICAAVGIATWQVERAGLAAMLVGASLLISPYALAHDLAAVMPAVAAYLMTKATWKTVPAMLLFVGFLVPFSLVTIALSKVSFGLNRSDPGDLNHPRG